MSTTTNTDPRTAWRQELPVLVGPSVTLREPTTADLAGMLEVWLTAESVRFGVDGELTDTAVLQAVERLHAERAAGRAFTYLVALTGSGRVVGAFQVRGLDPTFENAEWEAALLPSVRGSGLFMEAAQLVGTFVFGTLGSHRLEARVLLENGRANAALRKLGACQEGVLRRSLCRDGQYFDQVLWSVLRTDWSSDRLTAGLWVH